MAFVETRPAFFEADLLADTLRLGLKALSAGRALRAVDFFAELFFFFGLAIRERRLLRGRRKNGGLIKNISTGAQGEI